MRKHQAEDAAAAQLAAEEKVLGDVERGGKGQVLVHRFRSVTPRIERGRKCMGAPSRRISPSSGAMAPESALMSVDLPAAVVTDDGQDLAGPEVEVGAVERRDVSVALDESARLQHDAAVGLRSCPPPARELIDGDGENARRR